MTTHHTPTIPTMGIASTLLTREGEVPGSTPAVIIKHKFTPPTKAEISTCSWHCLLSHLWAQFCTIWLWYTAINTTKHTNISKWHETLIPSIITPGPCITLQHSSMMSLAYIIWSYAVMLKHGLVIICLTATVASLSALTNLPTNWSKPRPSLNLLCWPVLTEATHTEATLLFDLMP